MVRNILFALAIAGAASPLVAAPLNVRIVDASVFPKIPGFFIVTSVYMIGEKAADVIHAAAK